MIVDLESQGLRGIHRLAGAVLVQAIEDIRSGSGRRREDALQWMEDTSERHFSFRFCCRMLNRDPAEIRRLLEQRQLPQMIFSARADAADWRGNL